MRTERSPAPDGSFADTAACLAALARLAAWHLDLGKAKPGVGATRLRLRLDRGWSRFEECAEASFTHGPFIPWVHVCALFQLERLDQVALVMALMAELDSSFSAHLRQLSGAAAEGEGGGVPCRALARMLGGGADLSVALGEDGPLRRWGLVRTGPGFDAAATVGSFRLDPAMAAYLSGRAAPRPRLDAPLVAVEPLPLDQLPVSDGVRRHIQRFVALCLRRDEAPAGYLLLLQGPDTPLQERICAAAFAALGLGCLRLDGRAVRASAQVVARADHLIRLRLLCRDLLLCGQAVMVVNAHDLTESEDDTGLRDLMDALLSSQRVMAVVGGPRRSLMDAAHRFAGHRVTPAPVIVDLPDAALRRRIWGRRLVEQGIVAPEGVDTRLAEAYPLTDEAVALAVDDVAAHLSLDPEAAVEPLLAEACREQSRRQTLDVAREIRSDRRLDEVVLPSRQRGVLAEVLAHVRHRRAVGEDWGFAALSGGASGLCVLFHGPSGTGKTMAASAIATELGLCLYKIDLSSVFSKYIGETEKHLARLFDHAEAMNVVLFFDEAESLFARRTETRDSHDRYANLQTGYLLDRIERYAGTVILSTNLLKSVDQAFLRRFRFIVDFPFPGPEERRAIWSRVFPPQAPRADDLDMEALAENLVLSGGNIASVALSAAYLAADSGQAIAMRHVLQAAQAEYLKLGKLFPTEEFYSGTTA